MIWRMNEGLKDNSQPVVEIRRIKRTQEMLNSNEVTQGQLFCCQKNSWKGKPVGYKGAELGHKIRLSLKLSFTLTNR